MISPLLTSVHPHPTVNLDALVTDLWEYLWDTQLLLTRRANTLEGRLWVKEEELRGQSEGERLEGRVGKSVSDGERWDQKRAIRLKHLLSFFFFFSLRISGATKQSEAQVLASPFTHSPSCSAAAYLRYLPPSILSNSSNAAM